MKKINLGCGANKLQEWENYDLEIDITKPLPFDSDSVDFILAEHVIEHVYPKQALSFLRECYRILKDKGVIRVIFPDVFKVYSFRDKKDLLSWYEKAGYIENNTIESLLTSLMIGYGHEGIWSRDSMFALMAAAKLEPEDSIPNFSRHPDLCGIDYRKYVIAWVNDFESSVIEGIKRLN